MTTTTKNWLAAAIGLSLYVGMALCVPGQLMDELPRVYVDRLKILKTALALDEKWSAVWSETLTRKAVVGQPEAKFCEQIGPADDPETGDGQAAPSTSGRTYSPFDMITRVVGRCWYSGKFVKYGITLLSHAINCLFYRHAVLHITAVTRMLAAGPGQELNDFLRRLIVDYRSVVDKLAVVGAPLLNLLQVVTFFDDVDKLTPSLQPKNSKKTRDTLASIYQVSEKLREELAVYRSTYCAQSADDWYDVDTEKVVNLTLDGGAVPQPAAGAGAAQPQNPLLARADDLRSLMRRVFDGLYVTGMSQTVWKDIFTNHIFVKATDFLKNTPAQTRNVSARSSNPSTLKQLKFNV